MTKESPEARAERILTELRAATAEAAGVLKDLTKAVKSAHAEVEEYLADEVQSALSEYHQSLRVDVGRITAGHEAKVTQRVIDFAALIENNFSREALIQEAVNRILAELQQLHHMDVKDKRQEFGEVVISVCDRPHAD
ncbi:MAG TPA: hypothetical protein VHT26_07635 [Trebonia sp.]|jgi:hypothetical protein|nr:hypothetical protein [Trebonia sp.]